MNETRYRAGIIGLGFIGGGDQVSGDRIGQKVENLDGTHRTALSNHPRVDLVAGCDPDPGRRERFAERTGAKTYADWREMLAAEPLDIVSIATSPPLHAEITIGCAERGVRVVYCEKALATSAAEGDRMLAACARSGTLLVTNYMRRFNPNYHRLRELVLAGELGSLTALSLRWGTGRLACVGSHFFDAAQMITNRRIVAVSGTLDLSEMSDCRGPEFYDPGGWGMLKLEGDLIAVVNGANHGIGPATLTIEGTTGKAVTGGDHVEITWADGRHEFWPSTRSEGTSMDHAVARIVEWLDNPGEFIPRPEEALRSLEAVIAFHLSHARNACWVSLPLTGEDRDFRVVSG